MHRVRKWLTLIIGMALLSLGMAACSDDSSSGETETINVAIQGLNLQTLYPMAAQDLGYFEKEGANVKVTVNTVSGGQAIQAMLGGSYQMFFGGADSIVAASRGEKNLRIVAAGANSSIWNLVAGPGISTFKKLKGKKIAVLSDQGLLTQATRLALTANGLPSDSSLLVPAGNTPQRIAALSSGQVDAAIVSVPQNVEAVEKNPDFTDLGNLDDLGAPRLVAVALQVDQRWASKHKKDVIKMLRGYHALVSDLHSGDNDDKIIPYFAEKLGVADKYIEKAFVSTFRQDSKSKEQLPEDLHVDLKALQNTADSFLKFKAMPKQVDVKTIVDSNYLDSALK